MIRGILRTVDFILRPAVVVPVVMALCGCFAVLNASAQCADPYGPALRHVGWLVVGLVVLCLLLQTSIESMLRWAPLIAAPTILLIYASVFLPQISAAGMRGSIVLWPNTPWFLEPVELLRPVYILVLARFAPGQQEDRPISWSSFGVYALIALVWWVPLAFEPDPGLLLVHVAAFAVVYWLQGGQLRQVAAFVVLFAAVLFLLYRFDAGLGELAAKRCLPEMSWVNRSALVSAGMYGTPAASPYWSHTYLPAKHSFMAFLSFAEVAGFMGLAALLMGTAVAVHLGIGHARRRTTIAEALVFAGVVSMLAVETLLHFTIAGGLARAPLTPLTVLGFGGSSLVGTMVAVGLMIQYARCDGEPQWEQSTKSRQDG